MEDRRMFTPTLPYHHDGSTPSTEVDHFDSVTLTSLVTTLEELGYLLVRELNPSAGQALLVAAAALERSKPAKSLTTA